MKQLVKYTAVLLSIPLSLIATDDKIIETSEANVNIEKNATVVQPEKVIENKGKTQVIQIDNNKSITITIPPVPKVPQVKDYNLSSNAQINDRRSIKFSKRVPPDYKQDGFDKKQEAKKEKTQTITTNSEIGQVINQQVSAYLRGAFIDVDTVKKNLEEAGFTVLSAVPLNAQKDLVSVSFTNKTLLNIANKPKRGFIANLRVLVDSKAQTISISNPLYMAKGFLQDDFSEKEAKEVLVAILSTFKDLKNSEDALKYQLLAKYQFMVGMPYYHDMTEVGSGDGLLEKIKDNDKVLFTQTLENGATLIAVSIDPKTAGFIEQIGRNNAALLPYPILIENGKAKIMDPKYYISFMYPKLSMSGFMTIASVPDTIIKECKKVFE